MRGNFTVRCSIVPNTSKSGGCNPSRPNRDREVRLPDSWDKSKCSGPSDRARV